MEKKVKYPVDRSSFKDIREEGYLYVDKTEYVHKLSTGGKYFFLARPRRFGKSLLLSTLAEYFMGNRKLFKGLAIDRLQSDEWETYPVLRFDFSGIIYNDESALISSIAGYLDRYEKEFDLEKSHLPVETRFFELINSIRNKISKKVVILIDEYDSALSGSIGNLSLQEIYREQLHGFYAVLKKSEENIQFCMLTGVTRFGKLSVFSGLNNLNDITFKNDFAGVCGITSKELSQYYIEGIEKLALKEGLTIEETFELMRFHYDGYHFSESMIDIYNPFSINYALYNVAIGDYWCRSGVPTLLSKSLMENDYDIEQFVGRKVQESELRDLSIYSANPVSLFYQTGYLTIKAYDEKRKRFILGYPNREVENGILKNILNEYSKTREDSGNTVFDLVDALEEGNPEKFIKILSCFFSDIPLDLRENVSKYENYYHTIFYCLVKLMGMEIDAEYATSEGYIDILIKTHSYIYLIELKVNGDAKVALKQIEDKHYGAPFINDKRQLFKIGIGFSKKTGSITSSLIL